MSGWASSDVGAKWREGAEARNRYLGPATDAMFELARVAPGMRVLELGTGSGDVALLAAARVGPSGAVLATDASESMLVAAQLTLRGVTNVTVARMDAAALGVPDASFDAVIARMVLMFVDVPRALAEAHRALVPGGRFAATVWSALEKNPFHAALIDVARAHGPLAQAEIVRAFGMSDAGALRRALEGAGFGDVELRVVRGERRIASVDEEIAKHEASPPVAPLFASLDEEARANAWAEVARRWSAHGGVMPNEILAVGATR